MSGSRNFRNLAAWGYQSGRTDTRVEIDVWTVNEGERVEDDLARARRLLPDGYEVIDAAGDVAKVVYPGAAGTGYRRVSTNSKVLQQAFAGAARAAGGDRTDAGAFGEGFRPPPDAPDIEACVAHGRGEVIPAAARDLREAGARELAEEVRSIGRDETRDEVNEQVGAASFRGFRNAVRIYPRNGSPFEYSVDTERDTLK